MNSRRLGRNLTDLTGQSRLTMRPGAARTPPSLKNSRARILCITSGKGGTGKSVLTSNLAVELSRRGQRVLAVDADLGLANLHLLLGLSPRRNIYNSLAEGLAFREIAQRGPEGVHLVAGPSGVTEVADLGSRDLAHLVGEISRVSADFDLVLVDTAAGISRITTAFLYAGREIVLVTTPDITAMTDAYATLKTVLRRNPSAEIFLVVNRVRTAHQGREIFQTMDGIAGRFLGRRIRYLGYLPDDSTVRRAIASKVPAVLLDPRSAVAQGVREIGRTLIPEAQVAVEPKILGGTWIRGGIPG